MNSQAGDEVAEAQIRETYEEFEVGETTVAMIADPEARNAWIQSDRTSQVVP